MVVFSSRFLRDFICWGETLLKMTAAAILSVEAISGCAAVQQTIPGTLSNGNVISVFNSIDQSEVKAAQLARQKASSPSVRNYAERLVHEHAARLNKNLVLANRMSVRPEKPHLASALEESNQDAMEKLRAKSGLDFDRAYINYQIAMHEQAMRLARVTGESVDDSQLKQHLMEAGPDLRSHLAAALTIRQLLSDGQ